MSDTYRIFKKSLASVDTLPPVQYTEVAGGLRCAIPKPLGGALAALSAFGDYVDAAICRAAESGVRLRRAHVTSDDFEISCVVSAGSSPEQARGSASKSKDLDKVAQKARETARKTLSDVDVFLRSPAFQRSLKLPSAGFAYRASACIVEGKLLIMFASDLPNPSSARGGLTQVHSQCLWQAATQIYTDTLKRLNKRNTLFLAQDLVLASVVDRRVPGELALFQVDFGYAI